MNKSSFIALLAVMVILFCGCRRQPGADLMRVYELTETAPAQALAALDSINADTLDESDRRFYDFLRLKTDDKNYVRHTSDTTILSLIDYYKNDSRFGAEMLYYGGRVYSDLGDYPTALTYFQKALQATPAEENPRLRCHIASQTGRLLNSIKLHTQAVPYLRESLKLDSLLHDTVNLMYDHQLLGTVYLSLNNLDSASISLTESKKIATLFTELEKAEIDTYLGRLKILRNHPFEAINILRGVSEKVDSSFYNISLLHTAQAYMAVGLIDSAYIYVDALIHSPYTSNKHFAYDYILNSDLQYRIPEDSLKSYLNGYKNSVMRYLNTYEAESAIQQNSFYNYRLHESKRIKAEHKQKLFVYGIGILVLFVFALSLWLIYYKYVNYRNLIQLRKALDDISLLKQKISDEKSEEPFDSYSQDETYDVEELKKKLRVELLQLYESNTPVIISPEIKSSRAVVYLKKLVEDGKSINEDNPTWNELEPLILKIHPQFFSKIRLLFGRPLKVDELHIVLLIKSGFTPTEIAALTNRAKGSISSRRAKLCQDLLGTNLGAATFDKIIRLL